MKRPYAEIYSDLYQRHWWWRAREAIIRRELAAIAPAGGFGSIIDIGCGDGLSLPMLERFGRVEGVETDIELVSDPTRARWTIHSNRLEELRFDKKFGLVTLFDVVEHVPDHESFLRTAVGLLESGGQIMVTVPAFPLLWTKHDVVNEHQRRYTKATLAALGEAAGVRWRRMSYFFAWLAVPKLLARLAENIRSETRPIPSVPVGWLNRSLQAMSIIEYRVWRGLAPFGSSLLAIGSASSEKHLAK